MIPSHSATVAAIATAPGRSATALVRMSGPRAREIVARVCPALPMDLPPRHQVLALVRDPRTGTLVDRALVTLFEGPASYTGEDSVEISCHGGFLSPQLVLDALCAAGASLATAGEFTRRALLNGKLDLLQAEAILDVIEARSPALHRAAIFQSEKGLSRRIEEVRSSLLRVEALVAYAIDFPEEDEPPVPPASIRAAARDALAAVDLLLSTVPRGEMLREGALVVLAGRPNSGKSSLFNALLGIERAIVTDIPGTTRDAVEATLLVDGYPFRLVDTAGLRETADVVEGLGIEVARRFLAGADLVLFCAEDSGPAEEDAEAFLAANPGLDVLVVRTKADLGRAGAGRGEGLRVSVLTGEGIGALKDRLREKTFGVAAAGEPVIVTRERHARLLRDAREEIAAFIAAGETALPVEFAATHLRAAVHLLEELIGAVTPDDILGEVFGRFCVGK